ncbi:MAG: hypothetical protein ACLPZR_12865 [Solirubrobacteraceae bacterium]
MPRTAPQPNHFADLDRLEQALLAFARRDEQIARAVKSKVEGHPQRPHKLLERLNQPTPQIQFAA